jgi:DNA-binding transcriptional LysR family regulator
MELRQLSYFVRLAEHLHFGRAARALGVSPAALSMQLQALERSLDVRLVDRNKHSVALTTAGELFLAEARRILAQTELARATARRAGRGELGSIRIGYVISAACAGVVQRLLHAYHSDFPEISLSLSELESPEQIRLLTAGSLDACIVRTVTGDLEAVDVLPLLTEPMVIALPSNHNLASKSALRARDLAGESFIVPQFQLEVGFARHLLAIGDAAGFSPEIAIPTRDFLTALTLVGAGLGIAVVPESVQLLGLPRIVYRKPTDVTEVSHLSLVLRRNDRSPAVAQLRGRARRLIERGPTAPHRRPGVKNS